MVQSSRTQLFAAAHKLLRQVRARIYECTYREIGCATTQLAHLRALALFCVEALQLNPKLRKLG